MLNRKEGVMVAVTAALGALAVGGGIAIASATPSPPPPPPPTAVDSPEPGDTPDGPGDTDNLQEGDQNGPEVPDTPVPPAPPGG